MLAMFAIVVPTTLGVLWVGTVVLRWLLPFGGDPSLLEIFIGDLRWLLSRRLW